MQNKKSFFLFGPRGTGKSTWLRQTYPDALVIDLLESQTFQRLLTAPQELEFLLPVKKGQLVVIDKVQKVPALLDEVHRLIEKKIWNFALTGSSARRLRRGGVNLLAGRALTYRLFPLTAAELGTTFSLDRSLKLGHLPAVFAEEFPEKFLSSYVETYLREEVLQEGLTRNISAFARFLQAASFSHGSQLNVSDIAREAAIERKTVEGYFGILEDLLLSVRIFPFSKKAKRASVAHPKFYYFDAGVFRTLRPKGPLDKPEEIASASLEGLVMQELRATNDYCGLGYDLHYWRSAGGLEVDFVLYGEKGIIAIEVKYSGKVRTEDLRGLKAFSDEYPTAKLILLNMGEREETVGNIHVIPAAQALPKLATLLVDIHFE